MPDAFSTVPSTHHAQCGCQHCTYTNAKLSFSLAVLSLQAACAENEATRQQIRSATVRIANLRAQQEKPRTEPSAPWVRFADEVSIFPIPARKRVRFDSRVVVFGARGRSSIIRLGEKVSMVRQGRVRFSMKTRVIEIDRTAAPRSGKVGEILEPSE